MSTEFTRSDTVLKPRLAVFTEAAKSGLAWEAAEIAAALAATSGKTLFIAPPLPQNYEKIARLTERIVLPTTGDTSIRILKILKVMWQYMATSIVIVKARRRYDVLVLIHPGLVPQCFLLTFAAKLAGKKLLLQVHDVFPHKLRFPEWLWWLEKALYAWNYRRADAIATKTKDNIAKLSTICAVEDRRLFYCGHGPYQIEQLSKQPTVSEHELMFLVFGSLRENKNIMATIKATQCLRSKGRKVKLKIAGAPRREERAYWDQCLDLIQQNPDGIICDIRFIEDSELPHLLRDVDAFLMPYVQFDSQSGVAALAATNGFPIIASSSGGMADLFVQGVAGVQIAEPYGAPEIEQAMTDFANDATLIKEKAARLMGAAAFGSWNSVGDELLAAARSTLES